MDILFVNQSSGTLMIDIVNIFKDAGHKVTLFAGKVNESNKLLNRDIKVIKGPAYNRSNMLFRILTWLMFCVVYAFYLLFSKKKDMIFVVTNPPIAPIITCLIAKYKCIPFYILVYDLYPEALAQTSLIKENNMIFKIWKVQNRYLFSNAKKIFTISNAMFNAVSTYTDLYNVQVIYNWSDSPYVNSSCRTENPFICRYGLEEKIIVLYSGNMGLAHDLESIIEAAHLLQNIDQLFFLMIGDGAKKSRLKDMASKYGLTNVKFLPYQDAENFAYAMNGSDIGVVTLDIGAENLALPSKTYTNMAAGLCILAIASENSEISSLVRSCEIGVVCEPNNFFMIASEIKELILDNSLLTKYKNNAKKTAGLFTSDNAKKYLDVVEKDFKWSLNKLNII